MLLDDSGPREVEQVRVARDVARVVAEPLAAVLLLGRAPAPWISTPHEPSSTTIRSLEQLLELFDSVRSLPPLPA